jgi:hypothetical protein
VTNLATTEEAGKEIKHRFGILGILEIKLLTEFDNYQILP